MGHIKDFKFILSALFLNLALILYIYQSVFLLEIQGDTWQYAWGYIVAYGNTLFNQDSWRNLHTSLAGSYLTFALIKDYFGLTAIAYYSISVILKFLTVIVFYLLVKKLTNNNFASLIASLILSVSFAGVEATHWVFNMYAYIGLIFITLSILIGLDLPENYIFKRWLGSFLLACTGIWYATMRTNGIIIIIIAFSAIKAITLRSRDSRKNLVFWLVGFTIFILVDKFLLGQMETDYSQKHIIGAGLTAIQIQIANSKYDFIFSPASNLGAIILPDITWFFLNFPKVFSFLGGDTFRSVILSSLTIFTAISWILTSVIKKGSGKIPPNFILLFPLGLIWTIILYFTSLLGPTNFSSWVVLVMTLFGGYIMIFCLFLVIVKEVPSNLKDLFLLSFLWSFVFLLLPEFQNGGPILGTYQRYMVTTAPAIPMFMAGLLTLSFLYKSSLLRVAILLIVVLMVFSHASSTKAFFDRKAEVHNRQLSAKIWQQFTNIVPNKPEYAKEHIPNPPAIWFEAADNSKDSETLFETLYFGFLFQASIKYGWNPHAGTGLYHQNYNDLVRDVKKNPKLMDNFYAIRMENQSLNDVTEKLKQKIAQDLLQ